MYTIWTKLSCSHWDQFTGLVFQCEAVWGRLRLGWPSKPRRLCWRRPGWSGRSTESRQQRCTGTSQPGQPGQPATAGSSASRSWARRRRRTAGRTSTPSWEGRRRLQGESENGRVWTVSSSLSARCLSSELLAVADHGSSDRVHRHCTPCRQLQ